MEQNERLLTTSQIQLARTLAARHDLDIPFDVLCEYEFGKKFIDLFAFDPDSNELSGSRRISVITSYLYYDKDQRHLQFKLGLNAEDVAFMVRVLALYKFKDGIPRENQNDKDPDETAYDQLERVAEQIF